MAEEVPGGGSVTPAVTAASTPGLSAALHGGFSSSSMGRGSCTARASWTSVLWGLWYWWKPGSIPALLQGPSAAPGLWALPFPLTSMLMKQPEQPTATAMGDWGGEGAQSRRIECGIC